MVPRPPLREGGSILAETKPMLVPAKPAETEKQFTLDDVDPIGRTEAIIFGPYGSGKSVMAATFPPPFRWVAADGKSSLKSVRWAFQNSMTSFKDMKDLVAYVPVEEYDKGLYVNAPKAFNRMCDMVDHWFKEGEREKWEGGTLVLDSGTEISEWCINQGLGLNAKTPTTNKPLSKSHTINEQAMARLITGQQDYKSAMALFLGFIQDTRVMCARHNRNLVLLCHEYVEDTINEETGVRTVLAIKPLLIGQLREKIGKDFDDVWYLKNYTRGGKAEIKAQMHGSPTVKAKTRFGDILDNEEEPDYQKIIKKVKDFHSGKE